MRTADFSLLFSSLKVYVILKLDDISIRQKKMKTDLYLVSSSNDL